jgi:hypothetical protein
VIEVNRMEEVLHNALEECMEEEAKLVPSDSELKKIYAPSSQFKEHMNRLIRREKAKDKYKVVYMHRKGILQFVASVAILIIGIQVGVTLISPNLKQDSTQNSTMYSETVPESSEMKVAQSADGTTAKTMTEEATGEASSTQSDMLAEALWTATVTGTDEAVLTLTNTKNQVITYTNVLKVEKLEKDNWITIYSNNQTEENNLSSGESIDETIQLSDYKINENGSYRLYRNVNDDSVTVDLELIQ